MLKILIAPPRSGKTTWAANNGWRTGDFTVCPDSYRKKLTGYEGNLSRDKEVWAACYKDVREWLTLGRNVLFDATSTSIKARRRLINIAKECKVDVVGIYIKTPLYKCIWRNFWCERKVPLKIIFSMWWHLKAPQLSEGFKEIIVVK